MTHIYREDSVNRDSEQTFAPIDLACVDNNCTLAIIVTALDDCTITINTVVIFRGAGGVLFMVGVASETSISA